MKKEIITMSHVTAEALEKEQQKKDATPSRLYPKDQERVDQYLNEGTNKIERPPFKPLHLMGWLTFVIILLGVLSRVIGYFVLPA